MLVLISRSSLCSSLFQALLELPHFKPPFLFEIHATRPLLLWAIAVSDDSSIPGMPSIGGIHDPSRPTLFPCKLVLKRERVAPLTLSDTDKVGKTRSTCDLLESIPFLCPLLFSMLGIFSSFIPVSAVILLHFIQYALVHRKQEGGISRVASLR